MKTKEDTRIFKQIIVVIIFCLLVFSKPPTSFAKQMKPRNISSGITYLSTHWHYEPYYLSDEEIHRDFTLFNQVGLDYVTLVLVWKYVEPTPGNYLEDAYDDIERVCEIAQEHGLEVIIDFHTMMHEDSFTIPTWVSPRKFEQVFKDDYVHQAWLNYLEHSVSKLKDIENIHSWHMMNEPARSLYPLTDNWACDVSVDEFIELWQEMRTVFKSISDKPVSIRFAAKSFDNHFNRDLRIYEICDYIALNYYEEHCQKTLFIDIVYEIEQHSNLMISEFGQETDKDYDQLLSYLRQVRLFQRLGIKQYIGWYWRADNDKGTPQLPGTGFNLAKNMSGEPRPAFYALHIIVPRAGKISKKP